MKRKYRQAFLTFQKPQMELSDSTNPGSSDKPKAKHMDVIYYSNMSNSSATSPIGSDSSDQGNSSRGMEREWKRLKQTEMNLNPLGRNNYYIGGHVTLKNGIQEMFKRVIEIRAKSLAFFIGDYLERIPSLGSAPSEQNPTAQYKREFQHLVRKANLSVLQIVPHGTYTINLGSPHDEKIAAFRWKCLREVRAIQNLGLQYYNCHPGSSLGVISKEQSCKRVAESINWIHKQTGTNNVCIIIENTVGAGNLIGDRFDQLKHIIDHVEEKDRVGICLDTCHLFAAGYELRTAEACSKTFDEFDKIVGMQYLKMMHLNDCTDGLGSKKDRHANIGKGKIGFECFRYILNDKRFQNIPLVLETPGRNSFNTEIPLLTELIGRDSISLPNSQEKLEIASQSSYVASVSEA